MCVNYRFTFFCLLMNDDGSYTSGSIHSPFAKVENVSSEYTNINSVCRSYQL